MDCRRSPRLSAIVVGPSTSVYVESDIESSSTTLPSTRLTPAQSRPQATSHQAGQPLEIVHFMLDGELVVRIAPDIHMDDAIILDDPQDSPASKVDEACLGRICERYSILFDDVLVHARYQRAHLPPVVYTAGNRYICFAR